MLTIEPVDRNNLHQTDEDEGYGGSVIVHKKDDETATLKKHIYTHGYSNNSTLMLMHELDLESARVGVFLHSALHFNFKFEQSSTTFSLLMLSIMICFNVLLPFFLNRIQP